jgi:hypothetical protein
MGENMPVQRALFSPFFHVTLKSMETQQIQEFLSKGWILSEFSNWISYRDKENFFSILGRENLILLDEVDAKVRKKWKHEC